MARAGLQSSLLICLCIAAGSCTSMSVGGRAGQSNLLDAGLVGWQQMAGQPGAWRFSKGVLRAEGDEAGWLFSTRQYGDFVLSLEFRVGPGAGGGVLVRTPYGNDPATAGMRIQITDDYAERYGDAGPAWPTGSLVGAQAPSERASKAADVWQKMVITCQGPSIKVALNGKTVVDTSLAYFSYLQASRPGLGRSDGYVGLDCQAGRVEFRDIRIDAM